jgi:hypothetical protein
MAAFHCNGQGKGAKVSQWGEGRQKLAKGHRKVGDNFLPQKALYHWLLALFFSH